MTQQYENRRQKVSHIVPHDVNLVSKLFEVKLLKLFNPEMPRSFQISVLKSSPANMFTLISVLSDVCHNLCAGFQCGGIVVWLNFRHCF